MPFIPRTSNRACKELTMARIVACLNSPQGVDINSKHKNVPSPKLNSRLRPRRATCTTILNSPANKLSELYLSSPRRTPKPLSRVTGLNKSKSFHNIGEIMCIYIFLNAVEGEIRSASTLMQLPVIAL
ncbi:hypothetical protein EWB00_000680 [Schistosoma japonicum]|uniref:Uncharacterized protein n=1 Tax=Schistosoma japonicum TaxID=6182 RepID=A0A4Z2DI31_SCHJA|nr:Origin recognition complex subunit 1 [Schistosoma japonicum]KAH8868232.1 Origin recognition complex subunit 1 [Schistosoma japonicum]TNN16156.1 hypothetical protein EWB00_000680 [Schistosoma japonicum]